MTLKRRAGILPGIIITIIVLAIVGGIIVATSGSGDGDGGDNNRICHTYCLGVVQLECGSNKAVRACFGTWDCSPPDKGLHECKDSQGY